MTATEREPLTPVIFKRDNDGEIIALFPRLPGTNDWRTCAFYVHIGQHSHAPIHNLARLPAATPEQYAPLKRELEQIGYRLQVRKRCTPADDRARRYELLHYSR